VYFKEKKMKDYFIIPSFAIEDDISQTSIFYIVTLLNERKFTYNILDIKTTINYYDPPEQIYSNLNKELWLNEKLFDEKWIDDYIPDVSDEEYRVVLCSALFSMDIIFQGGYVKRYKNKYKNCKAIIGGAALKNLSSEQMKVISSVFDEIYTDDIICNPDYSLLPIKNFITVMTGNGCNWGRCNFCNSKKDNYYLRNINDIVNDFSTISKLSSTTEIMLSSDSVPIKDFELLTMQLQSINNEQEYNVMLRASNINKNLSMLIGKSGCSDIFLGVEIFDNNGLKAVNKGINVEMIKKSIINLSKHVRVQIGLILFLPNIHQKELDNQLINLEMILPYINKIELETLSVLYNSSFYKKSDEFGIKLFPKKDLVFGYWCYGLSPDIPWTFMDKNKFDMWFKYIDKLKSLINGYVDDQYWWHVDYIKDNYGKEVNYGV
jgi:hypothetical protein